MERPLDSQTARGFEGCRPRADSQLGGSNLQARLANLGGLRMRRKSHTTRPETHATRKSGGPTPRFDSPASRRPAARPATAMRFDTLASSMSQGLGAGRGRLWKKAAPRHCPREGSRSPPHRRPDVAHLVADGGLAAGAAHGGGGAQ
eukprot:8217090-Alexandrium_andersonii.AAC.1